MILEYGAKNFFCFKEWLTISFKLGQHCPEAVSQGEGFTKILGVKGANASGKTNVLKILEFLSEFCSRSFEEKPEDDIRVKSFFNNDEKIEFYVVFKCSDVTYRYELELTTHKILRETLFRTIKREVKVLERRGNHLKICNKEFHKLKVLNLRDNASVISTSHQYGITVLKDIYLFFSQITTNVWMLGLNNTAPSVSSISKFFLENKNYFSFVEDLITRYDPDIKQIEILDRELEEGGTRYFPIFNYDTGAKDDYLTFGDQSSGTKTLYKHLARYKYTLDCGGLLVLDEFDINLHPDILPNLLSLFLDKKLNRKNAQLIFTTHNTSILDFLGKYRSYLVNKEHSESYAYRLDEIPGDILRNDRDISPIYKSGKIGGIPKL